jgi:hypothetical protein
VTAEKQLVEAVDRYALERRLTVDMGPGAYLEFLQANGQAYRIPLCHLMSAPDILGQTSVTRPCPVVRQSTGLADPVWPHPARWDKPDD